MSPPLEAVDEADAVLDAAPVVPESDELPQALRRSATAPSPATTRRGFIV